jgi:hypothetical protein
VLISNKVNIWREIVADGAGFSDEDDRDGTARLLDRWLSLGEGAAEEMRRAARTCFAQRFEIHRAVESLLAALGGASV